jgi:periodic tryptophan protein 2
LAVDKDGHAVVIHHERRAIVHRFTFRGPVRDVQFSPDGRYLAVTNKTKLEVWRAPSLEKEFSPFAFKEHTRAILMIS